MIDEDALHKELKGWRQHKLEDGKLPCFCGHFESSHVKKLCIACHGAEENHASGCSCFHYYKRMDNLTIVEWFSQERNKGL